MTTLLAMFLTACGPPPQSSDVTPDVSAELHVEHIVQVAPGIVLTVVPTGVSLHVGARRASWTTPLPIRISPRTVSAALMEGVVVVALGDGVSHRLYGLNAEDGERLWLRHLEDRSIVGVFDSVLLLESSGHIESLDPINGTVKWSVETDAKARRRGERLVLQTSRGDVLDIDPASGITTTLAVVGDLPPGAHAEVVEGGVQVATLHSATSGRRLGGLTDDGAEVWSLDVTDSASLQSPALATRLHVADGMPVEWWAPRAEEAHLIDPVTGLIMAQWSAPYTSDIWPIWCDDAMFLAFKSHQSKTVLGRWSGGMWTHAVEGPDLHLVGCGTGTVLVARGFRDPMGRLGGAQTLVELDAGSMEAVRSWPAPMDVNPSAGFVPTPQILWPGM
jgi:hypothetical protein